MGKATGFLEIGREIPGRRPVEDRLKDYRELEGKHAETGHNVRVPGWEEWDLDENLKIRKSLGWFDAEEYDRQIREGV